MTIEDEPLQHWTQVPHEAPLALEADVSAESGSGAAVDLFRSLADPARLTILRHLALGEHRVVDLTAHLGLAQSTTSAHLACLRDCGLVSSRTVGRASMYSLAVSEELMAMLSAAERLLAATGDAVTLCPRNRLPASESAQRVSPERVSLHADHEADVAVHRT